MKHGERDYWSFVEKIQDATDYVQELLTENSRLQRRMADLEREKQELAQELDELHQMSRRQPPESRQDSVLRYQPGGEAGVSGRHNAAPAQTLHLAQ